MLCRGGRPPPPVGLGVAPAAPHSPARAIRIASRLTVSHSQASSHRRRSAKAPHLIPLDHVIHEGRARPGRCQGRGTPGGRRTGTDTGVLDTGGTKGIVDAGDSGWPRASSGFLVRQHLDGKTMMPVRSRDALCLNGERRWRIFAGDFGGLPRPRVLRVAAVLRLV